MDYLFNGLVETWVANFSSYELVRPFIILAIASIEGLTASTLSSVI